MSTTRVKVTAVNALDSGNTEVVTARGKNQMAWLAIISIEFNAPLGTYKCGDEVTITISPHTS